MAAITFHTSGNMIGIFTVRNHAIMTTLANANYLGMINLVIGHRFPNSSDMAGLAQVSSIDVCI